MAPNQFRAESEKGAAVVSGNVKNLLQNPIIIENLNITFAAPATTPSVTDVKTYLADDPVASAVTMTKEIAQVLDEYVKESINPATS